MPTHDLPSNQKILVWIDGKISRADSGVLPALDQAYLSGMGVFETIRAEGGVPFFLDAHFNRLADSASCFDLQLPEIDEVRRGILDLLKRQGFTSARIRVTVSGEIESSGAPFRFGGTTRTTILAFPLQISTASPLRLVTAPFRVDSASPLAGHKCTSYALHALAVRHARAAGRDDALMLDQRGYLVGCATGNLFWVKDKQVHTPDTRGGCRNGVTRERVIHACKRLGIACKPAREKAAILANAVEVFTTSSIRGIRSVTAIDEIPFEAGGVAKRIRLALLRELKAELRRT